MYKPSEVAGLLRVTRRTVYAWIHSGIMPAVKIGPKLWMVAESAIVRASAGELTPAAVKPVPVEPVPVKPVPVEPVAAVSESKQTSAKFDQYHLNKVVESVLPSSSVKSKPAFKGRRR